jgi:hypothetical protein
VTDCTVIVFAVTEFTVTACMVTEPPPIGFAPQAIAIRAGDLLLGNAVASPPRLPAGAAT